MSIPASRELVTGVIHGDKSSSSPLPSTPTLAASVRSPLPVVIPRELPFQRQSHVLLTATSETTKSFRGAFFSPFVRAWVPELQNHGIQQEDFLTFIDGLNEAWVSHPIFEGLGLVGGVLGMAHGVHPVQIASAALQLTSGAASAASSYTRTKAYVKAVNADMFHPAALHATVLSTKKMVQEVGYSEETLQLPPLETMEDRDREATTHACEAIQDGKMDLPKDDPRARRLQALQGYVMPLNFDVPTLTSPDNFLRKTGAASAARRARKQKEKMREMRERRTNKQAEAVEEQEKREKELGKEARKGKKNLNEVDMKEEKDANGIRWVVISRWDRDISSDDDSIDTLDATLS